MPQNFEILLQNEILKNERTRATILAIIGIIVFVFFLSVIFLSKDLIKTSFGDLNNIYIITGIMLFFVIREAALRFVLEKRSHQTILFKRKIYRILNTILEVSIISSIFFFVILNSKSFFIFDSPIVFLYFPLIILSILSLEFSISLITGITAGAEFFLIALLFTVIDGYEATNVFNELPQLFLGKAMFFVLSGILAGYSANLLKNRILNSLKVAQEKLRIQNMFGQQVSQEIVEALLESKGEVKSERKFACVMFLDIRGFTPFVESKQPEEIIDFQNEIFGFMIETIIRNKGIINQFLGDGYMATFGVPFSSGNDTENAVKTSLKILEQLKQKIKDKEIPETKIGIGLHAGQIVAGNVGTEKRKQYSVSGNPVIIAARIENLNKEFGSQILISDEVLERLDKEKYPYETIGPVKIKGREEPVIIHKLA
ncbi:MAG: hypothetical protein K8F36_08865 [Melioribacteraceae bacterium]|nr:hypothetical protein [Melioribacteraceae bacterium]